MTDEFHIILPSLLLVHSLFYLCMFVVVIVRNAGRPQQNPGPLVPKVILDDVHVSYHDLGLGTCFAVFFSGSFGGRFII